jgi:transcription elongation factor GreA
MCFPRLTETLMFFKTDADCEDAVAELLKKPSAPATLVTLILGRYEDFKHWAKLPPLVVILTHAIALGEGRQSGETLRMQNMIRRLFADKKWLETIFAQLAPADQVLFFERFQASIAWDPSTHHLIVVRMTHIVPELASRQVKKAEAPKDERITSLRSYAERKAAYQKLINVDIPANTQRIEFARSYGDLSENAEYQYAKDEQRALLQKQTLMQDELKLVKAVDFADIASDTVCPGTTVRIATADGREIAYTVLGEWDNDLDRGIIANKTRLAQNMLGKKAGETFDLPDADGHVTTATIIAVEPLSDALREWIKAPAGM